MCRLLAIRSKTKFAIHKQLQIFASLCKNSKEYQGHGWGCAYKDNSGGWKYYRNVKPIWEDTFDAFPESTFLIAHARSAFQDKDIVVENNMPFYDDNLIFTFNGELQGVTIRENGRTGAQKIFHMIQKETKKQKTEKAIENVVEEIKQRSRYIKAFNVIISDKERIFVVNIYNENPEYFQMYYKENEKGITICSEHYPHEKDCKKVPTSNVTVF